MQEEAEEIFNQKYLPILKHMYCCGFNDAISHNVKEAEKQLWASKQMKNKWGK